MQKWTHLIFAFLLFIVFNFMLHFPVYISVFAFIGAMIPDLDLKVRRYHRKAFHNVWFLAVILAAGFAFRFMDSMVAIALSVGFFSHLLSDAMTVSGISFFWPIEKPKIRGPLRTGSSGELVLMIAMLVAIFYLGGLLHGI